ncbi:MULTISPECIES: hypothetical protein [unclassified Neptuniibacter]|uniref:hypothetical protein n=1 Tax=unclassified Neptuniibacter TaxID=2630693 RepID=UPI0025DA4222|nr:MULTISPECIES: hypothetical protein [unclassified Neptuniibacter]|tara:strand:- start:29363 stop:29821 length:459 start_codon:yes stop_codon:yes gene_type:complete
MKTLANFIKSLGPKLKALTAQELASEFRKAPKEFITYKETKCRCMRTNQLIVCLEATGSMQNYDFCWIQRCNIYKESKAAEINHFGVTKKLLGCGIGKAFLTETMDHMRAIHGINQFIFNAEVQSDRGKFLIALGATQTSPINSAGCAEFTI